MIRDYLTIDDINVKGKTILCRLDLNSPMDPKGIILDDSRFRSHLITLKEIEEAKVVILSHQSRPGKSDFTTMEPHTKQISKLMRRNVEYVDDIFGSHAIDSIKKMNNGDINVKSILKLIVDVKATWNHIYQIIKKYYHNWR